MAVEVQFADAVAKSGSLLPRVRVGCLGLRPEKGRAFAVCYIIA